ncbi:hypothetical protein OF83DRAFT_1177194, partial [Amylostereum chailletii]
ENREQEEHVEGKGSAGWLDHGVADFAVTTALLEPLLAQPAFPHTPSLRSALARIYL